MAKILIIDDEPDFCALMEEYLEGHGHSVAAVHSGEAALDLLAGQNGHDIGLALLDIGLPGMDGFQTLQRIRDFSRIPIAILSASDDDPNRLLGLELGADDYVAKRTNPRELVARVNAILRRSTPWGSEASTTSEISLGDIVIDNTGRTLKVAGQTVALTGVEFDILRALVRSVGHTVSRSELSRQIMGRKLGPFDRSIDVHVSRLRRKLGPNPSGRPRIESVRGKGYVFLKDG